MTPLIDRLILEFDQALRVLTLQSSSARPMPLAAQTKEASCATANELSPSERRHAAGLMRVNHVGEVCAQALYRAQASATQNMELKSQLLAAAQEESDHLAWTEQRLKELGSHTSLLNPLWYAGAYTLGFVAGDYSRHQLHHLAQVWERTRA